MATKRARVNKTLEKAKKLISKKGKKKTTKRAYPEGQNAPQSKAYDMENDKVVPAKRTGYRFTKEGAKKLGKKPNDKPTADEIEKYRNETFKVKGKVNKSGPTGVGDGSFRYLYIESRADKSDLNKARKLEHGGETKNAWGVFYNGKLMFTEKSLDDAGKSAKMLKSEVDMPFAVSVEKIEENKMAKGGEMTDEAEFFYISGYWKNDKSEFKDYLVTSADDFVDDDGDDYDIFYYGMTEKDIKDAIKDGEKTDLEFVITSYSKATGIQTYAKGGEMAKGVKVKENEYIVSVEIENEDGEIIDLGINVFANNEDEAMDKAEANIRENDSRYEDSPIDIVGVKLVKNKMAKGGVVFDPKEVRRFEKYVFSWYGKNGVAVDDMEEDIPATTGEVLKAVSQYLAFCTKTKKWGGGDSFDREVVHDIIAYNRNPKTTALFYESLINDMKKTPILEYGGILQPMIGGVNADPRFDIYNTTMFAEKGAEVPEGDEYAKGGKIDGMRERVIDYYFENDVFDDYETYGLEEEDLKDSKKVEKAIIDYHDLKDPKNVKERYEVLGFDSDEYAKGGEVEESLSKLKKFGAKIEKVNEKGRKKWYVYNDGQWGLAEDEEGFYASDNEIIEIADEYAGEYAKGGSTHEQGYDDREDERLAMRHGKIASKDFVGSHKRREHSRRDDARFETRNK